MALHSLVLALCLTCISSNVHAQARASTPSAVPAGVSPDAWTSALAVTPDGKRVAAARVNGEVALLDPRNGNVLTALEPCLSAEPWALDFTPDGSRLAALAQDGSLCIWTIPAQGTDAWTCTEARSAVPPLGEEQRGRRRFHAALEWSATGERLLVGDQGGKVLLTTASGEDLARWEIEGRLVGRMYAWSLDGKHLYMANGSVVEQRSAQDGALQAGEGGFTSIECGSTIKVLALQPSGKLIATGHLDTRLKLWRVADGVLHFDREYPDTLFAEAGDCVADIAFSPSGERLAFSTVDQVFVLVIDPRDGREILSTGWGGAHFGERARLAWGSDGASLWSAFECGRGQLRRLELAKSGEALDLGMSAVPFFGADLGVVLTPSGLAGFNLDGSRRW